MDDTEVVPPGVREFTQAAGFLSFGGTTSVSSVDAYTKRRRPIHLAPFEQHNRSTIFFVTVCAHNRGAVLANAEMHEVLRAAWHQATWFSVGRYVIMPDHVHLFCAPAVVPAESLARWVGYWKSLSTRGWTPGGGRKLWQRDCWERQLRSGDSYAEKWDYVRNNPVPAGFVGCADEWEWQGELEILWWHR